MLPKNDWWFSTPKIINNKVLCVAIGKDGEETTSLFTLDELESFLTKRKDTVYSVRCDCETPILADGWVRCGRCNLLVK